MPFVLDQPAPDSKPLSRLTVFAQCLEANETALFDLVQATRVKADKLFYTQPQTIESLTALEDGVSSLDLVQAYINRQREIIAELENQLRRFEEL